ncbi:oxygen-independent coproporphyrinogen III oxidase protein [Halorhabdus tiamatea SARL4B]|uniref:tRNA-t(6)A37 methylthiotransferase n=1 Tax=Halorhabdus tiamatea SARL4B TaxID=1033806 RepID=F7PHQ0_9EURY|nr:tRNA (N(6)-L-threonylcarbamoyladenosine(37)-C(2))-methylthiotransferase [Halorhabdus tiamatea]ERJ06894.1 oxygen-independent coproporphyrinogen III oxidase protein [Halorhabdus tiamatea SARL4B]CCQ32402.1 tRNA-i(6)A37 methylthiotransferase [Halorhabdus tiamatea SARL4B]
MARYYIETYGCTSNRGESQAIERRLRQGGHYPVENPSRADVAILNTCTVVEKTERNMLRRATELDEQTPADLVVTGCMALAQGEAFEDADVDAEILHWDDVPEYVRNGECPTATPGTEVVLDDVTGILPIARGCLSDCSYCITKQATGTIDSPPVAGNVEKARELLDAGAREIRITGQDTGVYGLENGERKLPELLTRICELAGDFRVRVGMANPKGVYGMHEELADVFAAHDELYNFLHAPVQSGSDDVLTDMRRRHRTPEFKEIVAAFDDRLDYWTLATDFIVGFPTETEADFQQSMDLLRDVEPEKINVTRFSKRPGTDAAELDGLGGTIKKERSSAMTDLKMDVVGRAHDAMVGEEHTVLLTQDGTEDSLVGYDEAHRQVAIPEAESMGLELGDFVDVEITGHNTVYALGEPIRTVAKTA